MKTNAQIYSDKFTALQGRAIGEHGTFWKLQPHQSGFAGARYENAPDLTHKPSGAKRILNQNEYAAQTQAYHMERALTRRDQIFAELTKPEPRMSKVMKLADAILESGVPLDRISWKVTALSSGSGAGVQGLRQDPMAMVGPALNGAVDMLMRLENGEVLQFEDDPSFKFRPDGLKKVLEALKKGLSETLASNPPANPSANTSANAVGGNPAPARGRSDGTTVAPQLLLQSATVATGQPQPQRAPGAPGGQSAQSGKGAPYIRQRLELEEKANGLKQIIMAHEIDPTQVPAPQARMAQLQLDGVNIQLKRLDLAEADTAATTAHPVNTTKTTTATTTSTSTATTPNTGTSSAAKATEKLTPVAPSYKATVTDLDGSDDVSSS